MQSLNALVTEGKNHLPRHIRCPGLDCLSGQRVRAPEQPKPILRLPGTVVRGTARL